MIHKFVHSNSQNLQRYAKWLKCPKLLGVGSGNKAGRAFACCGGTLLWVHSGLRGPFLPVDGIHFSSETTRLVAGAEVAPFPTDLAAQLNFDDATLRALTAFLEHQELVLHDI